MSLPEPHRRSRLAALLKLRCPRCREGRLFKGVLTMNDPCPVCGLVIQREEGYFLGALYFSYGMSVVFLIPCYFLFKWLLPAWPDLLAAAIAVLVYLPLTPLVFRYSRVLWIYFDRSILAGDSRKGPAAR
jgi:uncharacterized protein (DUF983 family)